MLKENKCLGRKEELSTFCSAPPFSFSLPKSPLHTISHVSVTLTG